MTDPDEYIRPIVEADEFLHVSEGADDWRENFWLCFFDHALGIRGVVYSGVQPRLNQGFAMLAVFQHDDPLMVFHHVVAGTECDAATGRVGPIRFDCREPLGRWRITAEGDGVKADLQWTAMHSAYDWCWGHETRYRHFEQPGRVEGRLEIGGQRMEIQGWGQRDRGWGHRDPDAIRSCWSSRVFFDDGSTQHASYLHLAGAEFLFGYVLDANGSQLIDQLDLDIAYAYAGGPPLLTELRAHSGGATVANQQVRLTNVLPQYSVAHGRETQQFFTFSEFVGAGPRTVGQMDHWWTEPRDVPTKTTVKGNSGLWVNG